MALGQVLLIARIGKKGNFAGESLIDGSDFVNDNAPISYHSPTDVVGQFTESFAGRHLFFCPAIVSLYDFAGDVDPLIAV